jgi:hypothetical protein
VYFLSYKPEYKPHSLSQKKKKKGSKWFPLTGRWRWVLPQAKFWSARLKFLCGYEHLHRDAQNINGTRDWTSNKN